MGDSPARVSVVVPVYRETERINALVARLRSIDACGPLEIIVVDGDPAGRTLAVIEDSDVVGLRSERGRGRQLNVGAAQASGDVLLFLHADTLLPRDGLAAVRQVWPNARCVGGAFSLGFERTGFVYNALAWLGTWRARLSRVPFGDQGIFFRARYFRSIGGFADVPILEDVELMERVRRRGDAICILPQRVQTSVRRFQSEGLLFSGIRAALMLLAYRFGVPPRWLGRFYGDRHRLRPPVPVDRRTGRPARR